MGLFTTPASAILSHHLRDLYRSVSEQPLKKDSLKTDAQFGSDQGRFYAVELPM